ncbi:MAG: metallophosphoesterase [Candidatus Bathyarchaeia archaeon]
MLNVLLPYPAALVKAQSTRTLLISDPHIGWELELHQKGIYVPSQTGKILNKLVSILLEHQPDALVILGDVKYSVVSSGFSEWQDIPDFFNKLKSYVSKISIVKGNHDANLEPLLPESVELLPANGVVIEDVGVFHGHKWPSPVLLACKTLVMGHLHPAVVFRDPAGCRITQQVWLRVSVKSEAFARTLLHKSNIKIVGSVEKTLRKNFGIKFKASELYIMPSFNDFLGGKPLNEIKEIGAESLIGPVLRSEYVHVDDSELYLLDGTYIGTLNQLRT